LARQLLLFLVVVMDRKPLTLKEKPEQAACSLGA
jgi:hypothetical protein